MMNFKDLSMGVASYRGEGVVNGKSLNHDDGDCKLYFLTGSNCGQEQTSIIIGKKLMPDLHAGNCPGGRMLGCTDIILMIKSLRKINPEFFLYRTSLSYYDVNM